MVAEDGARECKPLLDSSWQHCLILRMTGPLRAKIGVAEPRVPCLRGCGLIVLRNAMQVRFFSDSIPSQAMNRPLSPQ
jgi:hypothetical protein